MQVECNAARTDVVINVPMAGQVVVPVYTRDGKKFEASPRGIGDEVRDAAVGHARAWVAEHPQEFEALRKKLLLSAPVQ